MFNVVLFGIVSLLTDISSEMVYPLLPIFLSTALGASPAIIGIIEGIAESLASLLKVFSGYLADKTQKKKELTISGYSGSLLGKLVLVLAGSWGGVMLSRIIDRLGKGIRTAPRDALIADSMQKGSRGYAFGLHRAMDTMGAVIGVIIAFVLVSGNITDFKRIFWFSTIPALLGIIALLFVKRPSKIKSVKKEFSFAWSKLDTKLKKFLILAFIFTLGNSSNQFLLLRASKLGVSTPNVLLLYMAFNISYALVSIPAGKLSDLIGRKRVLVTGYLIYAIVYFGFAQVTQTSTLWLLFIVYGLYTAFTDGVEKALLSDIAPSDLRGTVIGMHAALVGVALLPASFIAGILWDNFGAQTPFYFGAGMGLLAVIGLLFIFRDSKAPTIFGILKYKLRMFYSSKP
ncbi:MFS transporter [Desulfosporosinus sp. SB140]|uniref:MFS transporter n=1 Tax=Desulfosporosinus paludis TaxID=3115649 RepID=UPI00388D5528